MANQRNFREAKVVCLHAPGRVELCSEPLKEVGDDELLCETLISAISPGTEIAAYEGLPPLRPNVTYPRLLGYCNVARVISVGKRVTSHEPGDRVLTFMSHRSAFVIKETEIVYKLHVGEDVRKIVCTYLFHLGYNAILRSGVRAGTRVVVIGLGALGLTTVAVAALAGAKVFAISDQEHPTAIALKFGAETVFSRRDLHLLADRLGSDLADVVVTTTNSWKDWTTALQMAGKFGVIAVLGFPGRGVGAPTINPLDSQYFYARQLRIEAVGVSPERSDDRGHCRFNERSNIEYLASQISNDRLDSSLLVSGEFDATEIQTAYLGLLKREGSPITYLLRWAVC